MSALHVAQAISLGLDLVSLATRALEANTKIGALVAAAAAEGRDTVTVAEWDALLDADTLARTKLADLIAAKKAAA